MAGTSPADLNQDLSGTGYWGRYIDHLRRTASANKPYRFHSISCLDGGQVVKTEARLIGTNLKIQDLCKTIELAR